MKETQTRSVRPVADDAPAIQECWATVDGARMRYQRSGSGPALVLLHGLLGYAFSWRSSIPLLAREAAVYAVDMPGTGLSERRRLDFSFRASAERLLRFLDEIGVPSFDLLGTSHGGAVAMMAAAIGKARRRVRRLLLVAPVNPWSAHGRRLAPFLSNRFVLRLFGLAAPHLRFAHGTLLRRLFGDPSRIGPGVLDGYSRPLSGAGAFEYGLGVLSTWNEDLRELEAALPTIADIPTLLVWGTRDAAVDPASAYVLGRQFRHCTLVMMDGVGHLPYEEAPEHFNQVVSQFLCKATPPDPAG